MAAEAIIGQTHVFQVLFIDIATLQPIAVINPSIDVFQYDGTGARVSLVTDGVMTSDPSEVGRYIYPFAIDLSFNDGDTIYGYMTGQKPAVAELALAEQTVNLVSAERATGGGTGGGLRATFVKGG